jgi:Flagellar biosynthesis protein, FliO
MEVPMPDLQPYLYYIFIAGAALVALIVLWILMKLFRRRARGKEGMRLGISEYHEIDQSRRLVLVRRDNVEHLILIGGPQDVVVESGINAKSHNSFETHEDNDMNAVVPIRPIRPAVFGSRKPTLRPFDATPPSDREPA